MKVLRNPLADLTFAAALTAAVLWPLYAPTRKWEGGELYGLLLANAVVVIALCTAISRASRRLRSRYARRRSW